MPSIDSGKEKGTSYNLEKGGESRGGAHNEEADGEIKNS